MEYSPFANPLFIFPSGIIVVLDLLSFPIYFKWVKSGQIQKSKPIFFLKPFSLIICIYFLFTQYGAGEFLGALYCLVAPLLALYMFFSFLLWLPKMYKQSNSFTYSDKISLLLGVLLIFSTAVPSFLSVPIRNWCINANFSRIAPIAQAVEKYYSQTGRYPNDIDELVPEFISSIPAPSCGLLSAFPRKFELINCGTPIVFVKAVDFTEHDLYHLKDGSISHVEYELYICP
ncbi:MAG: hypothetical protein U0V48_07485 [Anaerolineales bacterium]